MRRRKEHIDLTASYPKHKPRGAPSSMSGSSAPGFGDSSGDTRGIPSDNPNKYTSTVTIIRPYSGPIENTTKYHSHVPKDNKSAKPSNMLMEYQKWISNRCSQNHINWKSKFKYHIPDKLRPRCSQVRELRGTSEFEKISNSFYPSYNILFVLKVKIHTDAPTRESENIPHQGTWDPFFIIKN